MAATEASGTPEDRLEFTLARGAPGHCLANRWPNRAIPALVGPGAPKLELYDRFAMSKGFGIIDSDSQLGMLEYVDRGCAEPATLAE